MLRATARSRRVVACGATSCRATAPPCGTLLTACCFSPDGRQAFIAGSSTPLSAYAEDLIMECGYTLGKTTLTSWDTVTGRAAVFVESPLAAGIHTAAFQPRQNELATLHTGGRAVHWIGGSVAMTKGAEKKAEFALSLAITPDLQRMVVAPVPSEPRRFGMPRGPFRCGACPTTSFIGSRR